MFCQVFVFWLPSIEGHAHSDRRTLADFAGVIRVDIYSESDMSFSEGRVNIQTCSHSLRLRFTFCWRSPARTGMDTASCLRWRGNQQGAIRWGPERFTTI
jgi:hypothetical protein